MARITAAQLDRDISWATRLYGHVAGKLGTDATLSELEAAFGFRWAPSERDPNARSNDPYFSRVLEKDVGESVSTMLAGLDRVCVSLPGLDPAERLPDCANDALYARNVLYNRLVPALNNREATQETLKLVAKEAERELVAGAIQRARVRYAYQSDGVRGLQGLCAAVCEGRNFTEYVDKRRDALACVLQFPPPMLANELKMANVPLHELQAYLFPTVGYLSGAVLELGICRWAEAYHQAVNAACIAALDELRRLSIVPIEWHGFSGVALWHRDNEYVGTSIATGGVDSAVRFPDVPHTHAFSEHVLVATATTQPFGLRVVRMARVVNAAVVHGLLRPRVVRASGILTLINLFGCAAETARERLTEPEADEDAAGEEAEGMLDGVADDEAPDTSDPETQDFPHAPAPLTQLSVSLHAAGMVPKSLLRDFVFLVVIREQVEQATHVPAEWSYIGVSQVVDRLAQLVEMPAHGSCVAISTLKRLSRPSLIQSVGHVMDDKVARGTLHLGWRKEVNFNPVNHVQYAKLPAWKEGTKGLCLTPPGCLLTLEFLNGTITQMQPPLGALFANEWHPSRAAKCHARRKQVPPTAPPGTG